MLSTMGHADELSKSVTQKKSMKLPPTLMQVFSISNNQARCIKCNFVCKLSADRILFHLTVCKGSLVKEKVNSTFDYNCLSCKFRTNLVFEWTKHLFKLDHITNSVDTSSVSRSYDCSSCDTHFYGFEDSILRHRCRPKELSMLSNMMAHVYESFKILEKRMLYACTDCMNYSYDKTSLHGEELCNSVNSSPFVCEFCMITFYDSSGKTYFKHRVYFEHVMLWCLNSERSPQTTPVSVFWQLPLYITKFFVMSKLLDQISCVVCYKVKSLSYDSIYNHSKTCFTLKEMSAVDDSTPLKYINCTRCLYDERIGDDEDGYKLWVKHVVSLTHLKNTIVKDDKHYLYSYYCYISETIHFGTAFTVQSLLWETNDEIDRLLFVSEVMADVYRRANTFPVLNTLHCCGICLYYTDSKFCKHKGDSSYLSFYCSSCLVDFNIKADYTEHLLSSEHIILKYFKPSQTAEVKILEHAMENTKLCQSILNGSFESQSTTSSMPKQFGSNGEACVFPNDTSIQKPLNESYFPSRVTDYDDKIVNEDYSIDSNDNLSNHYVEPHSAVLSHENAPLDDTKSKYILSLVEKLNRQLYKSGLNHFLRMKLELFSEMSTTMYATSNFVQSNSYFCRMCNLVFMDELIWTKHDQEFHKNIDNLSVFYCATCHVYYIDTCLTINAHIDSLEHRVMVDLQKYLKKYAKDSIKKSEVEQLVKKKVNGHIFVEIFNISPELRTNNFYFLRDLFEKKYSTFKQLPNSSNSLMMILNDSEQIEDFVGSKIELTKRYGFQMLVIGENNDKVLAMETIIVLLDWPKLLSITNDQLRTMNVLTSDTVDKLYDSLHSLYESRQSVIDVQIFGSQFYGLATKNSNVDIYVNLDNSFCGEIANNDHLQIDLVQLFAKQCLSRPYEFTDVKEIYNTRVPVLHFYHVQTKLNCDVSFKSGLDFWNSKLIKSYLSMDNTIKWIVCYIVKMWAPQNGLKDKLFTSYALVWIVLFYLISKNVIPSVSLLMKYASVNDSQYIEGWSCSFGQWTSGVKAPRKHQLLIDFFQYYSSENKLKDNVLCTLTGKTMYKNQFFVQFGQQTEISMPQRDYFKKFKSVVGLNFEKNNGLAVQDPFDLSRNITENITGYNLTDFCNLCSQSTKLLRKTKSYSREL